MLVRLRDSYLVGDNGIIHLRITVGEGQKGLIEVLLNGISLETGPSIDRDIGNASTLSGSKLRVTAIVTDTNPDTNVTSVTYELTGGVRPQTWLSGHTVDTPGDTVDYDAIFNLL